MYINHPHLSTDGWKKADVELETEGGFWAFFDIETAMDAQEDAVLERGIRCFNRLKTGKYGALDECYFEFNMV